MTPPEAPDPLSAAELRLLSELDSKQFGYLRLHEEANKRKKTVLLKALALIEHQLAEERGNKGERRGKKRKLEEENENGSEEEEDGPMDATAYRKLGHFHLLLENYDRALSAYEKYGNLCSARADKDLDYLYGKGLVYFHFNALQLSAKAFQEVLYLKPDYERACDAHVRLGIIRKNLKSFPRALKHLNLGLRFHRPGCHFTSADIRFHVAHAYEIQGRHAKALKLYKSLLAPEEEISNPLKSDILRQLGWIYYSVETGEDKPTRIQFAIHHLQKSLELDSKSGQCLYLLGRCYASLGKVHEAFIAYRNSVDKSESNADTWCSIGVLYQQQNQPMDALQAYICAVQLEKYHGPAWTNLGMLYESSYQFHDALTCYTNALSCVSKGKAYVNPLVQQRIKYLKPQLSSIMTSPPPFNMKKNLPSVEDAWNLPVNSEMGSNRGHSSKSSKMEHLTKKKHDGDKTIQPLTHQQLQTLQYLQGQSNLGPQQQQLLQQYQQHYQAYKISQLRQGQSDQNGQDGAKPDGQDGAMMMDAGGGAAGVSDRELEALISQQDINSFAESLLKEIEADGGGPTPMDIAAASNGTDGGSDKPKTEPGTSSDGASEETNNVDAKDAKESSSSSADKRSSSDCEDLVGQMSSLDIPTDLETVSDKTKLEISVHLKAEEIVQRCKAWQESNPGSEASCLPDPQFPGPRKKPTVKLSTDVLLPPTPSVHLETKKDAFGPQLHGFCTGQPITVLRGIANALKLDLGLFSTRCIAETNPKQTIHVQTQTRQRLDENWDPTFSKQVWLIDSKKSRSSLGEHASYQTTTFQDGVREEKSNSSKLDLDDPREEFRKGKKWQSQVKLGVCSDISDPKVWRSQLTELMKLPAWARVVSASNMLSHVGYSLPESNTVSLQMKVPFSRLSAYQDPNNFASVNLNIGPGECEWFAVPYEYWGSILNLCHRNGVDFVHDSWWPNMKDLMEEEIPVFRFLQRPGDMVWVNAGCIYWVQANGWCNTIKWNVGPLTKHQYMMAQDKWRWNRLQFTKSLVPMHQLSWNLARNIKFAQEDLYMEIKKFILNSMAKYLVSREYVASKKVMISYQGKKKHESAHFCSFCHDEIFALMFIEEEPDGRGDSKQSVVCFSCAKTKSPVFKGMVCIEEFSVKEVSYVYDGFKLQQPTPSHLSAPGAAAAAAANMFASQAANFTNSVLSF